MPAPPPPGVNRHPSSGDGVAAYGARQSLSVDHTQYETTSIIRLITARYDLPVLPGIVARDKALSDNGRPPMGDLTAALDLTH